MQYHKMRDPSGNLVYVHRYLVERRLGRKLRHNEVVDHRNGNKLDNRLSNLIVCDLKKHTRNHYMNGDYHVLTKVEMRKGAKVTNSKNKKKITRRH